MLSGWQTPHAVAPSARARRASSRLMPRVRLPALQQSLQRTWRGGRPSRFGPCSNSQSGGWGRSWMPRCRSASSARAVAARASPGGSSRYGPAASTLCRPGSATVRRRTDSTRPATIVWSTAGVGVLIGGAVGKNIRPAGLLVAVLMTVTGCTTRSATPEAEPDLCPPPAYAVDLSPPRDAGPVEDVDLGGLECADEATGLSTLEVTATNDDPDRDARYEVTVEFLAADGDVVATESAYLGTVAAQSRETSEVFVARPDNGKGLAVRLIKVEREFAADDAEQATSSDPSALEAAMEMFVREGLVPPRHPVRRLPRRRPAGVVDRRANQLLGTPVRSVRRPRRSGPGPSRHGVRRRLDLQLHRAGHLLPPRRYRSLTPWAAPVARRGQAPRRQVLSLGNRGLPRKNLRNDRFPVPESVRRRHRGLGRVGPRLRSDGRVR